MLSWNQSLVGIKYECYTLRYGWSAQPSKESILVIQIIVILMKE